MTQSKLRVCILLSASLWAICLFAESTNAQSTDVGNPTPLSSNSIKGSLEKQVNNFYTFQAGPGQVSAALFVEACPGGCIAQANLQLSLLTALALCAASFTDIGKRRNDTRGLYCSPQPAVPAAVMLSHRVSRGGARRTIR